MTQTSRSCSPHSLSHEDVVHRLAEAGRALLSLPNSGPSTRLVQSGLDWVRDAAEHARPEKGRLRPAIPDAATISRMDETLRWILLIPVENYVLRRIVGARSLVDPMTGRHLYSWRRIATAIGADHKAVQRWHAQGTEIIVDALRRGAVPSGAGLPRPASGSIRGAAAPRVPPRPAPGATAPS